MNQWCPDVGVDIGMSPGGKMSGILTLTTRRARPRILKATGQSCQSGSHTGRGAALDLRSRCMDAAIRGLKPGGSVHPSMNVRQWLFLALVAATIGSPCNN